MQTIPLDSLEFVQHCEHQSDAELQHLQDQLQSKMIKIQIQLDNQLIDGKNDWEHRARTSLRYATWRLQVVQRIQNQRKRAAYQELQQSFEHRFWLKAKELLDEDTFQIISDQANEFTGLTAQQVYDKVVISDNHHRPR